MKFQHSMIPQLAMIRKTANNDTSTNSMNHTLRSRPKRTIKKPVRFLLTSFKKKEKESGTNQMNLPPHFTVINSPLDSSPREYLYWMSCQKMS